MHLQTGKGDNIDALAPGMISASSTTRTPVTGASLTIVRRAQRSTTRGTGTSTTGQRSRTSPARTTSKWASTTPTCITRTRPTRSRRRRTATTSPAACRRTIIYRMCHEPSRSNVDHDMGLFAQDRWTVGRWTLPGGVRFDAFKNSFPEQAISPTFLGTDLNVRSTEIDNMSWKDITPKLGATYDLFGNGKTALKVTLNKYLEGMGTTGFGAAQVTDAPNPTQPVVRHRRAVPHPTWADTNRNFMPRLQPAELRGQRRVRRVDERGHLRHRRPRNQLRPGPDQWLGQAVLQLGVHDERAARIGTAHVAQRPVRAPVCTATSGDR